MTFEEHYQHSRAEMGQFFVPENIKNVEIHHSPSGVYSLEITTYKTREGAWDYTRGVVSQRGTIIAEIKRNYQDFPYLFIEGHRNGHDYLICGEDYQGYTCVELDTGTRVDQLPQYFVWAKITPHKNNSVLVVEGFYLGGKRIVAAYDFTHPLQIPYTKRNLRLLLRQANTS